MPTTFPATAFRLQRERRPSAWVVFDADEMSRTTPTGDTLTFDRNSGRTVLDSTGKVATLAQDQIPWSAVLNATTGVWEPVYDAQRVMTNLCLRSEDFGTTWSAVGSPTRTAGAKTCGDLALDLIGDDAGGALEGYTQAVTFTGNAVKAIAVFVAKGTSTSTVLRLRDTSASANRLLAAVTWSGSTPVVTMTTGTHIGTVTCADGVYRLLFQTTSVTAANTNQVEVYPATDAALATSATGTVYAGGVQAENYDYPHSYVKTLGSTVTTAADDLQVAVKTPWTDCTLYARVARPTWTGLSGTLTSAGICAHVPQAGTGGFTLAYGTASRVVTATLQDNAGATTSASQNIPSDTVFEVAVQFADMATAPRLRVDVGSGFGSYSSTITPLASSGVAAIFYVGQTAAASGYADSGVRRLILAPGARTLAELRGPQV